VLDTAIVADGDGASTSAIGKLNNTGTETELYVFTGWDKQSYGIKADTVITAVYKMETFATDKNVVITSKRHLAGCESLPYIIQKGKHL
jgi:hypothetical protein